MIKKLFTILMVVYPILNIYATPIQSVSISDMLLIVIIPFLLIDIYTNNKKIKLNMGMVLIVLYTLFQLLIIEITCDNEYITKVLMPTVRILVYFGTIALFTKTYFDMELGLKVLKAVALFVVCFLFVQMIFINLFKIYIPGTIPRLKITRRKNRRI